MKLTGLGRYSKFFTSLAGEAVIYLQAYGTTWHLVPAVTMAAAAAGVFAVPNIPKPAAPPAVPPA